MCRSNGAVRRAGTGLSDPQRHIDLLCEEEDFEPAHQSHDARGLTEHYALAHQAI